MAKGEEARPIFRTSLLPDEFLRRSSSVRIVFSESIDRKSGGAITIDGRAADLLWDQERCVATWSVPRSTRSGAHRLSIGDVRTKDGRSYGAGETIPFFVTDSRARVSSAWHVRHVVRLRRDGVEVRRVSAFGEPRPDDVDFLKVTHRDTDKPMVVAFDGTGARVRPDEFHAETRALRRKRFGKLDPLLAQRLEGSDPDDLHLVAFRLHAPPIPFIRLDEQGTEKAAARLRAHAKKIRTKTTRFVRSWKERLGTKRLGRSPLGPTVFAELTAADVTRVARSRSVRRVHPRDRKAKFDVTDSVEIARADHAHTAGHDGAGVGVGVWDDTPDPVTTLSVAAAYRAENGFSDAPSVHAAQVCAMLRHDDAGTHGGHAPGSAIYAADCTDAPEWWELFSCGAQDAATWAVQEKQVSVLVQAFHYTSEEDSPDLSDGDEFADDLVYSDPNVTPLLVFAAGNDADKYVVHKAFNGLVVASHQDAGYLAPSDAARLNPSSPHQDRELPEIGANGEGIDFPAGLGTGVSGSSLAAPAVGGAAAIIQQVEPDLTMLPEACRAILMAGARVEPGAPRWWKVVAEGWDVAYEDYVAGLGVLPLDAGGDSALVRAAVSLGAGGIDTLMSSRIAAQRWDPSGAPGPIGWDVHDIDASNFDAAGTCDFRYRIRPRAEIAVRGRIVLTWRRIDDPADDDWDLDVTIVNRDGVVVAYSGSFDNNCEIAEFHLSNVPWIRAYEVLIRLGRAGKSAAGSPDDEFDDDAVDPPSNPTRFAIAWRLGRGVDVTVADNRVPTGLDIPGGGTPPFPPPIPRPDD